MTSDTGRPVHSGPDAEFAPVRTAVGSVTAVSKPRLAIHLPGPAPTAAKVDLARKAADVGIDEFWISEDMFYRGAMATAAAVAAVLPHALIGIGVITPYGRHPATAAMDLRVIGELAHHFIVGVGTGVAIRIADLGADPSSPLPQLRSAIESLRWHLSIAPDNRLRPDADKVTSPPPIYVAATGERSLQMAGTIADGLILTVMSSVEHVRYAVERFGNAAADARRPTEPDTVAYLPLAVDDDIDVARQKLKPSVAYFVRKWGRIPNLARLFTDWGPLTTAQLTRLSEQLDDPDCDVETAVPDDLVDATCITGPPSACIAQLEKYRAAGLLAAAFDPGHTAIEVSAYVDQLVRLTGSR